MGRKIKYTFGEIGFTSKLAVRKYASSLFEKYYQNGDVPKHSQDYQFIMGILHNHIDVDQKVGCGIDGFFVDKSPHHPTNCFWLRRLDGVITDFGVGSCIDNPYQLNRCSLRELVRPQIEKFKRDRLSGLDTFISDFSGKTFPSCEAVVDHTPTFDELISCFFKDKEEDPRSELLTESRDASSMPHWKSENMAKDFFEYHKSAQLYLVHKRENLSDIKILNNQKT